MAHVLRPLMQWPRRRHRHAMLSHLLSLHSSSTRASTKLPFFAFLSTSYRELNFSSRARKLRDVPIPSDANESDGESSDSSEMKKSRSERKREARRAVRWGMELASFSPNQIKRILRVADLEQEATKDGDQSKFRDLSGAEILAIDDEEEGEEEISEEDEEEDSKNISVVTRWYDGLINKDISITNEIYSLREVEFDRQELRQLVRKVHSTLEHEASIEENGKPDAAAANARRSLTRFLQGLVKQLPAE